MDKPLKSKFRPPFKPVVKEYNHLDSHSNQQNSQNNNSLVNKLSQSLSIRCSMDKSDTDSRSQTRTQSHSVAIDSGNDVQITAKDGTVLLSVSELPQQYRCVFEPSFPRFNVIQSKVFNDIVKTDNTVVVCAPTGSGKTVILELAIVSLLMKAEAKQEKIGVIYMAPLKALCNEKEKEWNDKFKSFKLKIFQLTGDSNIEDYTQLNDFNILLTTPEKWDSFTRNWKESNLMIKTIQLMLIDEVHLIHDGIRGATMEAVISRMKTLRINSGNPRNECHLRFVAVSATAPNVDDIALWLSSDYNKPVSYNMSSELRPVKLKQFVIPYRCNPLWSDFRFDIDLSYRLGPVIKNYWDNKPTLVFCSTRKSVEMTANTLAEKNGLKFIFSNEQHIELMRAKHSIRNAKIRDTIERGIGFHHAGLDVNDRAVIEKLFGNGLLPVLISTSTLAMGINLPAHLVIIKNTKQYECGKVSDYSETTVLQMIGRAGRPQYGDTATAVIMTKDTEAKQYENMINGTQIIESNLHKHLAEHLNSEIVRKTIDKIEIAIDWLRSTYFYIRAVKNPRYYQIIASPIKENDKVIHMIQQMCKRELNGLNTYGMIIMDSDCCSIMPTPLGNIMAKNCVSLNTMKKFLEISKKELTLKELIENISVCEEINQDVMNRVNERKALNILNKNPETKRTIRFPIDGKVKNVESKVNCLIQATFESILITEQSLIQDSNKIMRSGQRISKCLADTLILQLNNYNTLLNSIILMKCFKTRLWHDSPYISKQLKGIGINLSSILVDKGLTTFDKLRDTHPREIEMVLNRHPPYGNQLLEEVSLLPRYSLIIEQNMDNGLHANRASFKLTVKLLNFDKLRVKSCKSFPNNHCCYLIVGNDENKLFCCQKIADLTLMRNDGIWIRNTLEIEKGNKSKYIYANYMSESFCGLDLKLKIKPQFIKHEISSSPESVSNEPNLFSDECLHKCSDKSECRHNCCKKRLPITGKRKTNNNENKNLKRTKNEIQQQIPKKLKDSNLDNWVIKKQTINDSNYPKTNEKSEYFLKVEPKSLNEAKLCEMNQMNENENLDEYDKLLNDEPLNYTVEDFQNFENEQNISDNKSNSMSFDLRQWSNFICCPLPPNPSFFIPQ